jgi:hypothetical protein
MSLLCGSANVTVNYPYITVSQHNTLEKFSFICRKITEFRHTEPRPESLVEVVPAQPAPGLRLGEKTLPVGSQSVGADARTLGGVLISL